MVLEASDHPFLSEPSLIDVELEADAAAAATAAAAGGPPDHLMGDMFGADGNYNGNAAAMRRIESAPVLSAAPLTIRPPRFKGAPEDMSSMESSQSMLEGSFSDESRILGRQIAAQQQRGGAPLYAVAGSFPGAQPPHIAASPSVPICVPAQGGYWAWVPAAPAADQQQQQQQRPPPPPAAGTTPSGVPVAFGGIPMAAPMSLSLAPPPRRLAPLGDDLDLDVLDGLDLMDMADELSGPMSMPMTMPMMGGMDDMAWAAGEGVPVGAAPPSRRAIGSCPPLLSTLLEDSLSAEDDGSDDTALASVAAVGAGAGAIAIPSARSLPAPFAYGGGSGSASLDRTGPLSASLGRRGLAPRSMPLKVHGSGGERGSALRSSSHPALSALAGSSPYTHVGSATGSDRPMRHAARRSLAVTAAALRDSAVGDSDSDEVSGSDGHGMSVHEGHMMMVPGSAMGGLGFGSHHAVPASGMACSAPARSQFAASTAGGSSGTGAAAGKKKHNPWSLEETTALVNGVRLAGVGKWAEIKRLHAEGIAEVLLARSPVDLKDKWRNLTRVARLPKAMLRARLQRGSSDVPLDLMLSVKQLMEAAQEVE